MTTDSFAQLFSDALDRRGFSPGAAARELNRLGLKVNRSTLTRWRNGETTPGTDKPAVLRALPDALGMSPAEKAEFLRAAWKALGFSLTGEGRRRETTSVAQRIHYGAGDLPPFAGRAAELAGLQRLVRQRRSVLITGMGGVGKTRLTQELLRTCAVDFPHGCEYLSLAAGQSSARILSNIAYLLGVDLPPDSLDRDGRIRPGRLRERLPGIDLLFMVDNVTDAGQVRDLIHELPGVTWVFTARRVSLARAGVQTFRLGLPAPDEAAAIFHAHLADEVPADVGDVAAVGTIVDRLGRLPFALRLAAAHLSHDRFASLAELDQWLGRGGLHDGRSLSAAQTSLFNLMVAELPPGARSLLEVCSLFASGRVATSRVVAVSRRAGLRPTAADWETLGDYAMVDFPTETCVEIHALLHDHLRARVSRGERGRPVREAFAAHYLDLAESVGRDKLEIERDYTVMISQEANLLAAAEIFYKEQDWPSVRRIWPVLSGYLWRMSGRRAYEAFDTRCLEAALAMDDEGWAARLRSELGYVRLEEGDWAAADTLFRSAQEYYDAAPDHLSDQARLRRYRAQVTLGMGKPDEALALLAEAERRLESAAGSTDTTIGRMLIHSARMTVQHQRGDLAAARAAGAETARLYEQLNLARKGMGYGEFLVEYGDILYRLGQTDEAARQWQRHVSAREGLPPLPHHAEAGLRLAWLAALRGERAEATRLAQPAREAFERHDQPARAASAARLADASARDDGSPVPVAGLPAFDELFPVA